MTREERAREIWIECTREPYDSELKYDESTEPITVHVMKKSPIQIIAQALPEDVSDEEIRNEATNYSAEEWQAYIEGAKWMRSRMRGEK